MGQGDRAGARGPRWGAEGHRRQVAVSLAGEQAICLYKTHDKRDKTFGACVPIKYGSIPTAVKQYKELLDRRY